MRPGKRKALDKAKPSGQLTGQVEKIKASIRATVEHPFRVIKQQFGQVKVRYRGLVKNTALNDAEGPLCNHTCHVCHVVACCLSRYWLFVVLSSVLRAGG